MAVTAQRARSCRLHQRAKGRGNDLQYLNMISWTFVQTSPKLQCCYNEQTSLTIWNGFLRVGWGKGERMRTWEGG